MGMRWRGVRLTVRRMMGIVAAFAVVLGIACALASRRARFLTIANRHWDSVSFQDPFYKPPYLEADLPEFERDARSPRDRWHIEMTSWYRYAADHPWLPLRQDPPEPE